FVLSKRQATLLNAYRTPFSRYAGTARYFTRSGVDSLFYEGDVFRQRDLAYVLRRIRRHGPDGFYRGETADLIVAEMQRGGGLITHRDLEEYRAIEREPVTFFYRGHRVISMGPPSSGGIALAQLLRAVETVDVVSAGYHSSALVHRMAEAMRRTYADRSEWLGDPDFVDVPVESLISPAYVDERMSDFNPDRVTPSSTISHGSPLEHESHETTHYSITDRWGNAVSVTTTLNGSFGSHVVVDGAGFFLNNEMDDFSSKPGSPDMFGLVGNEANSIEPGKRMLSSMTPTIVEEPGGRLFMVIGSPGGSTIITTVFQVIMNVIDHGMDIQQAVAASRFHHQWLPDELRYERFALQPDVVDNLISRGWSVVERSGVWGRADGIVVSYGQNAEVITEPSSVESISGMSPEGRLYHGGADPRGEDVAVGY
ncbi:MAG: gamma-glutamyltransferase, partial [Bacteroidota bacterium]